jgi:hypothetical protein
MSAHRSARWIAIGAGAALFSLAAFPAQCGTDVTPAASAGMPATINQQKLAKIVPGQSTKTDIRSLLGAPWRVVQFNDCGMAMDDQADETWEYRGTDTDGGYRIHVEFGNNDTVHLLAKIPDRTVGGKATGATIAPGEPQKAMSQKTMSM